MVPRTISSAPTISPSLSVFRVNQPTHPAELCLHQQRVDPLPLHDGDAVDIPQHVLEYGSGGLGEAVDVKRRLG